MWKKYGKNLGKTWRQNLLCGKLPEEEWKKKLRMNSDDFFELVSLIRPFFLKERSDKIRIYTLGLDKRVTLTLYYLKDQGSY